MKKILLSVFIILITTCSFSQTSNSNTEFNFGFERKSFGASLPLNWLKWGNGYELKIDTAIRHSGKASVLIEPTEEKLPNSFGCIAYSIPANYKAKEIELIAYMKLNNVNDGPIGLMLRIDGPSGELGFENMQSKNIMGTKDWTRFSVKLPYPSGARTIFIGAILSGKGQLWVDDFQVLLDGIDINKAKQRQHKADNDKEFDNGSKMPSIELTNSKLQTLSILGKVWGYLKYYHPAIAAGDYNWDYELFRIAPKLLAATNENERNAILNSWVLSLGKFDQDKTDTLVKQEIKLIPDLAWINQVALGPELTASLNQVKQARRTEENYYIGKVYNPGPPEFTNERSYNTMNYPDVGFRLLCLYRYWNIIQYYFPYKNLIEEDWNKILEEYIPKFVNAGNELEYKLAVLSLIARIHDTHANIWGMDEALNNYRGKNYAPLEITFVENKAVVTYYFDQSLGEKSGLKIGDVIVSIDNESVEDIVKEKLPLTPASNYPTQLRDIGRDLLRTNKATLDIKYRRGTKKLSAQIETLGPKEVNIYSKYQKIDTCFKLINSDIAYLYPGAIKNEFLPKIMAVTQKAKGLIIDFRCYPSDYTVFTLSEYLLPDPKSFVKFSNCSITTPGLFTFGKELKVGKVNPEYYKGKIVIIINETTQSSAEFHTMAFRTAPNAVVIGSTTAGADGDVSKFWLPGVAGTMISGRGIYYPDGRETQRLGIVPDIEIRPTINGIRDGKDELLEKAISIINGN
jgi:C-terminal processing protease CtpA/Prc